MKNLIWAYKKVTFTKQPTMNGTTHEDVTQLKVLKRELPDKILKACMGLQEFMDKNSELDNIKDDTHTEFCEKMCDVENGEGLFDIIKDLLYLVNTQVLPPVKKLSHKDEYKQRITFAALCKKAADPEDKEVSFCPRCSRPIRRYGMKAHRQRGICVAIATGREATIKNGSRYSRKNASDVANAILKGPGVSAAKSLSFFVYNKTNRSFFFLRVINLIFSNLFFCHQKQL
jgi:hypothetical protein